MNRTLNTNAGGGGSGGGGGDGVVVIVDHRKGETGEMGEKKSSLAPQTRTNAHPTPDLVREPRTS